MNQTKKLLIEELTAIQFRINITNKLLIRTEKEWEKAAKKCEYCQVEGADGFECSHPDADDFLCEGSCCPLIN